MRVPKTASGSITAVLKRKRVTVIGHDIRDPHYVSLAEYRARAAQPLFAFAFVRNPWDRLVSAFFYLARGGKQAADLRDRERYIGSCGEDFEAFVHGPLAGGEPLEQLHFRPQHLWISDDEGNLVTNFVGRFESLQADLDTVCRQCGLWRKRLGFQKRGEHAPYRDYYDAPMRDIVAQVYQRDIELFDYEF
jgi:chondroitin 4-sulfotransferase 11